MIKTAIELSMPVAIRYPRGKGAGVKMEGPLKTIAIGKGEVLREGPDLLILAIGSTVVPSMAVAKKLETEGIHTTVINSRFLKPLDEDLFCHCAAKIGKVLTVEEHVLQGGFGSAVLEIFQERGLSVSVKRLGIPDLFVEHGPQSLLRARYGIDEDGIRRAVKEMLGERGEKEIQQSSISQSPEESAETSIAGILPQPK